MGVKRERKGVKRKEGENREKEGMKNKEMEK